MHPRLMPGSPPPQDQEDVEAVLRAVPDLACWPELDACVPDLPAGPDAAPTPAELTRLVDAAALARVLTGLESLAARAESERSGGLAFLVRTLTHFLVGEAALPAAEHPLLVALYLRGVARAHGRREAPPEIARAMDGWA